MISAEIVADSRSPHGDRLTSLLITFPRFILAEINTHRMLSKNTSSSRAIPFKKMVEAVQENPFIPIAWQKHHSGMQGSEYLEPPFHEDGVLLWIEARDSAVKQAQELYEYGITKQLANRLLEPFMWTTMLITGSKEGWDNFFELRCPQYRPVDITYKSKRDAIENEDFEDVFEESDTLGWLSINEGQAEIHIMDLAEKIYDAMNESIPKQLEAGEWHIPMLDKIPFVGNLVKYVDVNNTHWKDYDEQNKVKISTALGARTSYTVVGDEKEIDYERMINLHDRLIEMRHDSPLEHCAKAMDDSEYQSYIKGMLTELNPERDFNENIEIEEPLHKEKGWCRNFKGFIQYRHIVETNK